MIQPLDFILGQDIQGAASDLDFRRWFAEPDEVLQSYQVKVESLTVLPLPPSHGLSTVLLRVTLRI